MASASPTSRSLANIRERGYTPWVVEYWNSFSRKRVDLYGIFDIIAVGNGETLAVQTTSGANVSARVKKIADSEYIDAIRKSGWRVEVHGWRKSSRNRWVLRIVDVS
ncbi:hypothetical protein LF41_2403 [Lysobacter dokdonensis DS-58]|uniref:Uncharacterized protein n=1 Tax=Lysobacter dokdonensis DS-58 TaxID=1300345 RepID=A0A0A2WI81_9GAMM|nr:hypothetical protein [Lysobacter dokdonensis]KGQ19896.1 hypothetical protein LF41_2403 [Lysobacter dokdonensis DS-58]